MKKVGIIGFGGHALVVAEVLVQTGYEIVGYFEKSPVYNNHLELKYLGCERDNDFELKVANMSLFPAIGDNWQRRKILTSILSRNLKVTTALSKRANISPNSSIDVGSLICAGVCINPFSKIGKGVIVNTGAIVEHECVIANFAHVAPGAVLAGNVKIGENSFIGANAVIKQGIQVGKNVTIGAGTVVLKDIPDNQVWVGNPSKRI